jgi:hypothetical protein
MSVPGSIAVIGAGIAGLACARRLADAGLAVAVFDKGRGIGGRMATRRMGAGIDHGAQYFTARSAEFRAQVADWLAAGAVAAWDAPVALGRSGPAYVGTPRMTAPAQALAHELVVTTSVTVTGIVRRDGGWSLATADRPDGGEQRFDAVVLAVPWPQGGPLGGKAGVAWQVVEPVYAPCWALLLAGGGGLAGLPDVMAPDDPVIAWVARGSAKPGRGGGPETAIVHATPDWSRAHLEEPGDTVAAALMDRLQQLAGPVVAEEAVAHRWRYALVEQAAGLPCLWDGTALLGACGDWCLGGRVEAAFDSGRALAVRVMADLGTGRPG